jgi:hypothetical protein
MRVVLEGRVQIGLRWMAGIPGLGKKAEVGQPERSDHGCAFPDQGQVPVFCRTRMYDHRQERGNSRSHQGKIEG